MSYQRLSSEERFLIARNFAGSKRVRAIARLLGRGRAASTVSRELGRNGNGSIVGRPRHELRSMANRYDEFSAHQKAVRSSQFGDGPGSGRNRLVRRLRIGLSNSCQEAIARSKSQPLQVSMQLPVSHAWIYSKAASRPAPWRAVVQASALARARGGEAGSGKDLHGFIPNRVSISQRPQRANLRSRVGDWQGDPVVRRISKAGLLVLVERRSRLIKLERLSNRPATTVAQAICSLLKGHKVRVRVRSITADHGQEFAAHGARSRKINAPFFLADRYRAWQR